ncbi:MAG: FtsQ-type POTRA domain-containing protein [Clostridia bacterium]|nr:FtsQ-type POTRA domain-containing protein [Clostridia bacterium]
MEENNRKEEMREHRRGSKIIFITLVIVAFLLALGLVTSLVLLLFPVREIEVEGDSRYAYSEIIDISKIKTGDRLYFVNENKAEKRILSSLPYLESVEVNSYFPNKVRITIKQFDTIYLVRHERGFCYVNDKYEILEIVEAAPNFEDFSGICIKLEKAISGEIGDVYNAEDSRRADDLIKYIKQYGFYQYLNIVDVEHKYNNAFVVGKQYKFIIGAMADVEEKIDASFKVVNSSEFKHNENCIIDTTDKKKVVLRYIDDENIRKEFDFCEN